VTPVADRLLPDGASRRTDRLINPGDCGLIAEFRHQPANVLFQKPIALLFLRAAGAPVLPWAGFDD
jgi:hypothetical protein